MSSILNRPALGERAAFGPTTDPQLVPAHRGGWQVRSWIGAIDPLRGIAAVSVVIHHASQAWRAADPSSLLGSLVFWLGAWGVTLFFVISGFCIHLPHARKFAAASSYRIYWSRFAYRRARRLLPTHYSALIASAVLALWIETELLRRAGIGSFVAHVFMVHVWYGPYFYSINQVFWSIAVECHFYMCYPVYLLLRKTIGSARTVLALMTLGLVLYFAASIALRGDARTVGHNLFLVSWWQWALGAALADVYVRGKPENWMLLLSSAWSAPLWAVLSLAVGLTDITVAHLHIRNWLLPVFCAALVGSLVLRDGGTKGWPGLSYLGRFSYSIYLVHPVVFGLLFLVPGYRGISAAIGIPLTVITGVSGAWMFYWLVERHFMTPPSRT